nr:putative regulator of Vps4 activity in the MVB pathway protein [Tanacetum cinerariifolium]
MGIKLDALLSRKFKNSKFKGTINLAVLPLSFLKYQCQARLMLARSDIVQLLSLGHHEHALLQLQFAQLTTGSKDVKGVIDKRKRKKSGVIEISWAVYVFRGDLATSSNLVSTNPAIARNKCPTPPKSGNEFHDHVERRDIDEANGALEMIRDDILAFPIVDGIDLGDPKKDRRPIEVDNPFAKVKAVQDAAVGAAHT